MELDDLEAQFLLDARFCLIDAKLLPLESGILSGLLLLLLLLLSSTTAVILSLDIEAHTDIALLLNRQLNPANRELACPQLE